MALTSAPACASCVFGAASTSLLSFTYHAIETITVSVVPHITVYTNGSRITNYQSITQTQSDLVGSGSGSNASRTYSKEEDITWTVGDATLTYPNTYIQYLGFEGAPVTTNDGQSCAQASDAYSVNLGPSTDAASFIYALPTNATNAVALPTPLLEYLAELAPVSSEFNGQPLTGCAPLNYAHVTALHRRGRACSTTQFSRIPSTTPFSRIPIDPRSLHARFVNGTGNSTAPLGTGSGTPVSASSSASEPTNTHTTGFIIQPITGKPIVTTEKSAPSPKPVQSPKPAEPTTGGGNEPTTPHPSSPGPSQGAEGPSPQSSGDGEPNLSGLLSGIGHVATQGASPTQQGSGPGSPSQQTSGGSGGGGSGSSPRTQQNAKPEGTPAATPGSPTEAVITTNGHTFTAVQSGGSLILQDGSSTATVPAGSAATFEGQTIKAGPSGSSIAVNGHEIPLSSGGPTPGAIITAGGHTFTAIESGSSVILGEGSSTIAIPNGSQTVFEGQTVSADASGSAVVVNGKTTPVFAVAADTTSEAIITAEGHTFTAIEESGLVILEDGSSTVAVSDGSQTVFEGQTISAGPSGDAVVVNGKTVSLSAVAADTTSEAIITAGGHTFTAIEESGSVILEDASSTVTVKDGLVITFDGQIISIGPSGTAVVVNGKTVEMTAEASSIGLSGYISGGLTPATGGAVVSRSHTGVGIVLVGLLGYLAVL